MAEETDLRWRKRRQEACGCLAKKGIWRINEGGFELFLVNIVIHFLI